MAYTFFPWIRAQGALPSDPRRVTRENHERTWADMDGKIALSSFDPQQAALYESASWVAYYRKQWLRLARLSLELARAAFGMPIPSALYGSYLAARALMLFAPDDNDVRGSEAYMRRFYSLIKRASGGNFDVALVAQLEVDWWVVHRDLSRQPDKGPLVQSLVDYYQALFGGTASSYQGAALYRVQAMTHCDGWVRAGRTTENPLLTLMHQELLTAYTLLHGALQETTLDLSRIPQTGAVSGIAGHNRVSVPG